jgi:hypothetical protein
LSTIEFKFFCFKSFKKKSWSKFLKLLYSTRFFQIFQHILLTLRSLNTFVNAGWYISLMSDALVFLHALHDYDSSRTIYSKLTVTSHLSLTHQSVVHSQNIRV